MSTTKNKVREWLVAGQGKGYSHMIVMVDDFDHFDYPVFVKEGCNIHKTLAARSKGHLQRVLEVYSYKLDIETQLCQWKARNI
jgi:hypothetical protein